MNRIRVGTRASPLALWQAERIAAKLRSGGAACELVRVVAAAETVREAMQETDLILVASHRVLQVAVSLEDRPGLICLGPSTAKTAVDRDGNRLPSPGSHRHPE